MIAAESSEIEPGEPLHLGSIAANMHASNETTHLEGCKHLVSVQSPYAASTMYEPSCFGSFTARFV